jgi:hypothetical protein
VTLTLSTQGFWRWLMRWAYRHWALAEPVKPVGIPGHRDPENPCTAYAPRPARWNDWQDCHTDGHYLCRGCAHRAVQAVREGE